MPVVLPFCVLLFFFSGVFVLASFPLVPETIGVVMVGLTIVGDVCDDCDDDDGLAFRPGSTA